MTEAAYQSKLIKNLEKIFPGCLIMKNDSAYRQGFPDLTVLWRRHWATLEVKPSASYSTQPNQEYYVKQMSDMSFSAFIHPENEQEVLLALQEAFAS